MQAPKRILFLVPYPLRRAPSQRFRVELYEPYLKEAGIEYAIEPFLDEYTGSILYKPGLKLAKVKGIVMGFLNRLTTVLFRARRYDYVFIHREAAPLGPPVFEWLLAKLLRKRIIYDFDDAIWLPNTSEENKIVASLKAFWKVKYICKWSYRIAAGNQYLHDYARQFNDQVVIIPTCVDVVREHNQVKKHEEKIPVVGWTGSQSTIHYLDRILPVLTELRKDLEFSLMVISNKDPQLAFPSYQFIPWNAETEVADLLRMDIGIMPLIPDIWSEGKCGFKLIQYLSLGIPAIADPVGVNKKIVLQGENGFLPQTDDQWTEALSLLIRDTEVRQRMGLVGRESIAAGYSIQANLSRFLHLFE